MARAGGKHDIWIALNAAFPDSIEELQNNFKSLVPSDRIVTWEAPAQISHFDPPTSWRQRTAEIVRESFLASLKPDAVHLSSLFETGNVITSIGAFTNRYSTAVTQYDLIPLIYSNEYLRHPAEQAWYQYKLGHLRRAGLWFAISQASRQEAIDWLGLPPEKVVNLAAAANPQFRPLGIGDDEERALRQRYGLSRPFVMYTGGIDYRKNIEGLINAYAQLPAALRQQYQLAIVCSAGEDRIRALTKHARRRGLAPDELVMTGFVPDNDLIALYNLCTAFCFPSWHEGFGLPPLEAMQCGAATIGANTSSVPEVIGRADATFDPHDESDIAARLHQVLTDQDFRQSLKEHGPQQARKFTWEESARRAWAALEADYEETRERPAGTVFSLWRRPRLAYVSPLPPEQSGIADYSAELLPELARHYDIDVIVNQSKIGDPWIQANCPARNVAWFKNHSHRYQRILYQFGNSPVHQYMFELADQHPGVIVLHDFYLGGAVAHMDLFGRQPGFWARALYQSHGYHALHDRFHKIDVQDVATKYPANLPVLQKATGVIVHSDYARRLAVEFYGDHYCKDWAVIPHLRRLALAETRASARNALGFDDRDFVICSFGIIHHTKMSDRLLDVLLNSRLASESNWHLVFVGKELSAEYVRKMRSAIRAAGAQRHFHITDYVEAELWHRYLNAADIAVQLRTRSSGETSGSVLDCMAHGVPTIVNGHGSLAEFDHESVYMLPEQFSDDELIAALKVLHDNPNRRRSIGERGRAFVRERLSPRKIADQFCAAIERFTEDGHRALSERTIAALAEVDPKYPNETEWLQLARVMSRNTPAPTPQRQLLIDITALVERGLTTGEQAVSGTTLKELILSPPPGYRVEPVYRASLQSEFIYARSFTLRMLDCPTNVLTDQPVERRQSDVLINLS